MTWPMGSKHGNTSLDGWLNPATLLKRVCISRGPMSKNKFHLITFHESLFINLWTFQPTLVHCHINRHLCMNMPVFISIMFCACISIHIHYCVYPYLYTFWYTDMCICVYICEYASIHRYNVLCMYIYSYTLLCISLLIYILIYRYVHLCIYIHISSYVQLSKYVVCVHIHMQAEKWKCLCFHRYV